MNSIKKEFNWEGFGKPVFSTENYTLYALQKDGGWVITGIHAASEEAVREVHIPACIGDEPVVGVEADLCCDGYVYYDSNLRRFPIGEMHLPDDLQQVMMRGMNVKRLALIPTEQPRLKIVNGLLLSADGRRMICIADAEQTRYAVPEGVEVLEACAFEGSQAEEILLPSSLREIGDNAFYKAAVAELEIPAGVKTIGSSAFANMNLTEVKLPDGLEELGPDAFSGSSMARLILPDGLKQLGHGMLYEATVGSVHLPESLRELPDNTFAMSSIGAVEMPRGLEAIGMEAFHMCSLRSICLPEGIREIGEYAFYACTLLREVNLPASLKRIGDSAFARCYSLRRPEVPEGVELGFDVFKGCRASDDDSEDFMDDEGDFDFLC